MDMFADKILNMTGMWHKTGIIQENINDHQIHGTELSTYGTSVYV